MAVRIIYAKNTDFLEDMKADKFPQLIRSVVQKHVTRFNLKMIRALAFIADQTTLITIDTAEDGDWILNFTGTLADGTDFNVDLDAFAASGDTADQIAAGLEAIIEAARADVLLDIVSGEAVVTDTITVDYPTGVRCVITLTIPGVGDATIASTFVAIVDETTRLNAWPVMSEFYNRVIRGPSLLRRITPVAGLTTFTVIVGDANDDNGLIESTDLTDTAGVVQTLTAAEAQRRYEAAFIPQLTFTSDTPFGDATAGEFTVEIENVPVPIPIGNVA